MLLVIYGDIQQHPIRFEKGRHGPNEEASEAIRIDGNA
jgi:hypothetical protein